MLYCKVHRKKRTAWMKCVYLINSTGRWSRSGWISCWSWCKLQVFFLNNISTWHMLWLDTNEGHLHFAVGTQRGLVPANVTGTSPIMWTGHFCFKIKSQRPIYDSPPSPTHPFLTWKNFTNPSPCSQFFFMCTRSPNLCIETTCWELQHDCNTSKVSLRFCDDNWEKAQDVVKICHV